MTKAEKLSKSEDLFSRGLLSFFPPTIKLSLREGVGEKTLHCIFLQHFHLNALVLVPPRCSFPQGFSYSNMGEYLSEK
jgi:hypothetical protein